MRRTATAAALLAALALFPACDSGEAERPSFRVDVTGAVEATLTGRPRVGVFEDRAATVYTFVLQSDFLTSVGLSVEGPPRVGTFSAGGSVLNVFAGEGAGFFVADGGEIAVESVEDGLVRARFAFDASEGFDGGGRRVRVEGEMLADLDDRIPVPTFPQP